MKTGRSETIVESLPPGLGVGGGGARVWAVHLFLFSSSSEPCNRGNVAVGKHPAAKRWTSSRPLAVYIST